MIKNPKLIILSIYIGVLYAASDEWHQSFNMNRIPLVADVMVDSIGVISGSLAALAWYSYIYRKSDIII